MANFYKATNKKTLINQLCNLTIERLDDQGRGVGTYQKKPIFVDACLPGEKVKVKITEQTSKFIKAKVVELVSKSDQRVKPACQHYHVCGGCQLQHLSYDEQLLFKQNKVNQLFSRAAINENLPWQPTINATPYHYRRKARIGVQYQKNKQALVGFRQSQSNHVVPIKHCPTLVSPLTDVFIELTRVLNQLSGVESVGHVEVIAGNNIVLVVRQLIKLSAKDKSCWQALASLKGWQIYFDDGKTLLPLATAQQTPLNYPLLDGTVIHFTPSDFIQVNHDINQKMVAQACEWLALEHNDIILDLFCGLGNFSLPIAKQVKNVVGVEGVQKMVDKAIKNAEYNSVTNCQFFQADLNSTWQLSSSLKNIANTKFNKVVLDPARAGAEIAVQNVSQLKAEKILYISCDPATLARDSKHLIANGYQISKISIIDMFSQTKHVETMVLFTPTH